MHLLRLKMRRSIRTGAIAVAYYFVSSAVVVISICITVKVGGAAPSLLAGFFRFDASDYAAIVDCGYAYQAGRPSNVAFFPAYPCAARLLKAVTAWDSSVVLLLITHSSLVGAFVTWIFYLRRRSTLSNSAEASYGPMVSAPFSNRAEMYSLWLFALSPTTFFFRLPYTEALFVFSLLLALYAMQATWPLAATSLIVGFSTAVRPVGVALLPLFVVYAVHYLEQRSRHLFEMVWILPLASWGVLGYMAFLQIRFGDALAFAGTQFYWRMRPFDSLWDKVLALCSLRPFWSVYVPNSPGYFGGFGDWRNVFGQLRFFNPLFFGASVVLALYGAWKRWLNNREVALACLLLAIPYVTRSHEMYMEGHARFAAVVMPSYIVAGQLLARSPRVVALALLLLCTMALAWFSAGYGLGRPFF